MRYLLMICSDGVPTPEKTAVMQAEIPSWLERTEADGARLFGHELQPSLTAKTVMVKDGQTLVSDGPFAESKEFVAGFDLIEAADLDEALQIAARHPVAKFHCVEVRPLMDMTRFAPDERCPADGTLPGAELLDHVRDGRDRYLMFICVDGIAESDEVEAQILRDMDAWAERVVAEDMSVFGHPLAPVDAATTVRVRDGETLISDGPFVEAKEFIAGFTIVDCATEQQAIDLAAANPIVHFHRVEVRRFAEDITDR